MFTPNYSGVTQVISGQEVKSQATPTLLCAFPLETQVLGKVALACIC